MKIKIQIDDKESRNNNNKGVKKNEKQKMKPTYRYKGLQKKDLRIIHTHTYLQQNGHEQSAETIQVRRTGGDNGGRQIIPDRNSVTRTEDWWRDEEQSGNCKECPARTAGTERVLASTGRARSRRAGGPIPFTSVHSADRQWSLRRQDWVGSSAARNTCGWLGSRRRTMAFATLSCSFSRRIA